MMALASSRLTPGGGQEIRTHDLDPVDAFVPPEVEDIFQHFQIGSVARVNEPVEEGES
jgi:hypothetical protein